MEDVSGEITIEGNQYKGKFKGEKKQDKFSRGSEYTEYLEDNYWWEGVAEIQKVETGEFYKFLFRTSLDECADNGLVESLLKIDYGPNKCIDYESKIIITNQKSINDLLLKQMYEDASEKEKTEIIPEVYSGKFSYKNLLEKALVAELDSGQVRMAL